MNSQCVLGSLPRKKKKKDAVDTIYRKSPEEKVEEFNFFLEVKKT